MQSLQGSVLLLLGMIFSGAAQQVPHILPYILVDQSSVDFGEIRQGEMYVHKFLIMNRGKGVLIIEKILPDQGCSIIAVDWSIPPGGKGIITIEQESRGPSEGEIRKNINVFFQ
jgi:hypothetical protein